MQETVERVPVNPAGVYPQPSQPDYHVRDRGMPRSPPYVEFDDGGEDVKMPQKQVKRNFQPDVIGTVTVTTAGAVLLLGVPFGTVGAVIGGVLGFALGVYNERR